MVWGAILGAGATLAGSLLDYSAQGSANRANRELAREQMRFQERMSSTAIERRVKDLKQAGLNPMLGFQGEASSPQGARAEMQSKTGGRAAGTALSAVMNAAQVQNIAANTKATQQTEALTHAQTRNALVVATEAEARLPYTAYRADIDIKTAEQELVTIRNNLNEQLNRMDLTEAQTRAVEAEIKRTDTNTALAKFDLEQLKPLMEAYQKLMNQAEGLGIPEKQAMADFWTKLPGGKYAQFAKELIRGMYFIKGGSRGGS